MIDLLLRTARLLLIDSLNLLRLTVAAAGFGFGITAGARAAWLLLGKR